jgi:hypothetical protein
MNAISDDVFSNVLRTANFFIERSSTGSGLPVAADVIESCVRKAVRTLLEDSPREEQDLYVETIVRKRGVSIALGAIGGRCGRESACPRSS